MDLFKELVGGEENLPPKLTTPTLRPANPEHTTTHGKSNILDGFGNLQIYDEYLAQQPAVGVVGPLTQQQKRFKPASGSQDPGVTGANSEQVASEDDGWHLDTHTGKASPIGTSFVPWLAAAKFPYKFISKDWTDRVDVNFFNAGKVYTRGWGFYYAWYGGKAIPFVRQEQFEDLLRDIHKSFPDFDWKIEQHNIYEGFVVTFDDPNPDLRPRFLGHTNIKEHYNFLLHHAPMSPGVNTLAGPDDDRSLEAFMERMELAADIGKAKSKGAKKAKQAELVVKRQEMTKQLLRAQRYLGLNGKATAASSGTSRASAIVTTQHDAPPPYACDMDVIFIAIDVEAYERSASTITEVGVATLDTRDLKDVAPGKNGEEWQKLVRGRHFRVLENKNYVNHEFVQGCPERFEFGTSEFVSLQNIASVLTKCFHAPFSKPDTAAETRAGTLPEGAAVVIAENAEEPEERRNLILLGHDTNQDIQYLHTLGFSVLNRGNLLEVMDTAVMFKSFTRDNNSRALGHIVSSFEFTPWNLHNAGNDAVYTVWAMLAICVKDACDRGGDVEAKRRELEQANRESAAVARAKDQVKDEAEGWDTEKGDDGGAPRDFGSWIGRTGKARQMGQEKSEWDGAQTSGGAKLDV